MRLLDRYLLRELLIPLAFCFGGFLIFWVAFDLFSENLNRLQEAHLGFIKIVWYYVLRLPELLVVALPVGLLLGLLYALTTHARHHELTAIRAAGVSVWRLAVPYLAVGFVLTVGLFLVNEFWEPYATVAAEQLLKERLAGNESSEKNSPWHERFPFRNGRDHRIWLLDYNQRTLEMRNIHVDWQQPDGSVRVLEADRGIRTNGNWFFFNVKRYTDVPGNKFPSDRVITNQMAVPEFNETPEEIKDYIKISGQLNNWQKDRAEIPLIDIIRFLRFNPTLEAREKTRLYTKLHGRLAAPWTCLVVVLIAIPFGAASGRRNVFVGVASGIFISFAYFIFMQLGLALGAGGYVPPWLAAWSPNILFGGTSLVFIFRVR